MLSLMWNKSKCMYSISLFGAKPIGYLFGRRSYLFVGQIPQFITSFLKAPFIFVCVIFVISVVDRFLS